MFIAVLILFIFIFIVWLTGKLLDQEAERIVDQMYLRDSNGVIEGDQSIEIQKGYDKALVLLHGFFESPETYNETLHDISDKITADIYIPLLPFQGRNLQSANQFNNQVIAEHIKNYLTELTKKYQNLTVVGSSYSGAMLINLLKEKAVPEKIKIILSAPAIYIIDNNWLNYFSLRIYRLWRKYCNYECLGCRTPFFASADEEAKAHIANDKGLHYVIVSAVMQLFKNDSKARRNFKKNKRPITVVIAENDNRVSYEKIKAVCLRYAKYYTFYSVPTGHHCLYWGKDKGMWEEIITKMVNNVL